MKLDALEITITARVCIQEYATRRKTPAKAVPEMMSACTMTAATVYARTTFAARDLD